MISAEAFLNDIQKIKQQSVKNTINAIIGLLNINSFTNKFGFFADEIIQVFDFFLVFESKLDNAFPTNFLKSTVTRFLGMTEIN